ncbi:Stk1 family PASTA domain-containing Ser/Thr kinase [Zafaria sp. J156]|uniref:Stk1 family PASTA domain-containing Ser/Thr kinase n=1 Tax=Zafaria sp. J156 TaxID=3116490 RepID=UPI002E78794E|nr:Stk1 family PASTA domain-containing Ser/Thr kinase [Zafaria sp. J156]MEE1621471.1 Stk1 family PASTA domain-containing Ser/Thr kinase [Zafaria sp. J156]
MTQTRIINGRYDVGELIGRGGMADVHRGRDIRLGRDVAIKLLRRDLARDPMFQARFRREAQAVAGLNHPAVVAVYDTGEEELGADEQHEVRVPYIVMEFVEGRTLRELIKTGELTLESSVRYARGVLAALAYSHRKGIVHRDIKPANVMVTGDDEVKVMDFGIARALADSAATMTQTQAVVGTAQYLSPEQARGETVDARSDLYSAGCLLFELLTGRPPFTGDSPVSVAYQHVSEEAPTASGLNPEVFRQLDEVLATALRKDRDERYQDADAFAHALEAALAGRGLPDDLGDATQALSVAAVSTQALNALPPDPTAALTGLVGPGEDASTSSFAAVAAAHSSEASEAADDAGSPDTAGGLLFSDDDGHDAASRAAELERERYERSRRRAWITVFTVLAVLVVAAGAWFLWSWSQAEQARNATVPVPEVSGMSETQAQNEILAANLRLGGIEREFSDDVPDGEAIRTTPGAGESVRVQSEVVLVLSQGPENVLIPESLEGLSESAARSALEQLKLVVDPQTVQKEHPSVPARDVLGTNPAIGEQVKVGSTVQLILSSGKVTVPNLSADGMTEEKARQMLEDEALTGLQLVVNEVENSVVDPGFVTNQSPRPGELVDQNGVITIDVAKAPAAPSDPPGESSPPADESSPPPSTEPPADGEDNGDEDEG